jgi:hypothetical protein
MQTRKNEVVDTLEFVESHQPCLIDFDRIQVAPQLKADHVEFKSLSLAERQELLIKLINRVKSL